MECELKSNCTRVWSQNLKGRDHLENLGADRMITFKPILNMVGGKTLDSSTPGQGPVTGSRAHDNEPSHSIKDRKNTV
jgi:hypothetical protein